MDRLLLHICCAICCLSTWDKITNQFDIEGFWYNPNIHPQEEYNSRLQAVQQLKEKKNFTLHLTNKNDSSDWLAEVQKIINQGQDRCLYCYHKRLSETAMFAKANSFSYFSTTLLSSPYQKHNELKQVGEQIAKQVGINFYYHDFRPLHYQGKKSAREMRLYIQKYCGCIYSRTERNIS